MAENLRQPSPDPKYSRIVWWTAILAGLALAIISFLADDLGIGGQPGVFGWIQGLGAIVGIILIGVGGWKLFNLDRISRKADRENRADPIRSEAGTVTTYDSAEERASPINELAELYRYRYLLRNLITRDLKVRYKRSALGFIWAFINPLMTMLVLWVVFSQLFRFEVDNYPLYILSGLLIWNLFARGTLVAMRSVLDSSAARRKIYIPASIFLAAAIGSALINLMFALAPLLAMALIMGVRPEPSWLFLPVPILQTTLFAFAVGTLTSSLVVFFADIQDIYEVLLNAYFYFTPIIYPVSILPAFFARLEQANPLYHFIDLFRANLMKGSLLPIERIVFPTLGALALLSVGWSIFTRLSDRFVYRA